MKKIISAGLVLVAMGCGQAAPGTSSERGAAAEALQTEWGAAPLTAPLGIPLREDATQPGCSNDVAFPPSSNAAALANPTAGLRVDPFYRKNGAEAAARKEAALAKMAVDVERAPLPPVDPKVLEAQAEYLTELDVLRAKHHHQDTAAFERDRIVLKERLLGSD